MAGLSDVSQQNIHEFKAIIDKLKGTTNLGEMHSLTERAYNILDGQLVHEAIAKKSIKNQLSIEKKSRRPCETPLIKALFKLSRDEKEMKQGPLGPLEDFPATTEARKQVFDEACSRIQSMRDSYKSAKATTVAQSQSKNVPKTGSAKSLKPAVSARTVVSKPKVGDGPAKDEGKTVMGKRRP